MILQRKSHPVKADWWYKLPLGYYDREGAEFKEGDIFSCDWWEDRKDIIRVIFWDHRSLAFNTSRVKEYKSDTLHGVGVTYLCKAKIISNIHDEKEI